MLNASEIERIGALWSPDAWPEGTDSYTISGYRHHSFDYYVERIRHLGISGGTVMDAGCGGGRWSFALATAFEKAIGFDLTPRRISAAIWQKEQFDIAAVEFVPGDLRKFPAADASVDAVYCNSVLFGGDPMEMIFSEFFRVIRPGGVCFVSLNAPGYAIQLVKGADAALQDFGRRRVYNTYCRRHLSPLIPALRPKGALNGKIRSRLRLGPSLASLLADLRLQPDLIAAAEGIAEELDPDFTQRLFADLDAICAGSKPGFGDREGGRDFDPDEIAAIARTAGFGRFEWAPDGCLSLQADGSVENVPCAKAPPNAFEFEGRLRVFEALMWKPGRS